jgi:hypothetical protein
MICNADWNKHAAIVSYLCRPVVRAIAMPLQGFNERMGALVFYRLVLGGNWLPDRSIH